jgi:hypothetical protein
MQRRLQAEEWNGRKKGAERNERCFKEMATIQGSNPV